LRVERGIRSNPAVPPSGAHKSGGWGEPGEFHTTRWSVVLTAGQLDGPGASEALEWLCRVYWPAVFTFIRRRGTDPDRARDLTQAFFLKVLDKGYLGDADRARGRFRTFLLTALTRFLANEHDRETALKRGGGVSMVPLDLGEEAGEAAVDPADVRTPESAYEVRWAETLLQRVLERLRLEFDGAGKAGRFDALKGFLMDERGARSYLEVAQSLGTTESAVKAGIHRLRRRYGELIREEISQTVARPEDVEDEIRHLLSVLGG
jgi:RNA polymerase sigma-70 factor (ECF subfamily)